MIAAIAAAAALTCQPTGRCVGVVCTPAWTYEIRRLPPSGPGRPELAVAVRVRTPGRCIGY